MGDLSQDFSRYEFTCRCGCGFNTVDAELLGVLQPLRDNFNDIVHISSGCRCLTYNTQIGGASKSFHMWGQAGDIKVGGASPKQVADYLERMYKGWYGIGRYSTFTHVDVRSGKPARWGRN